jgi:hypothetical protein
MWSDLLFSSETKFSWEALNTACFLGVMFRTSSSSTEVFALSGVDVDSNLESFSMDCVDRSCVVLVLCAACAGMQLS